LTVTWQDTLPEGMYAIVGSSLQTATGVLFRYIFEDQIERPGALAFINETDETHPMFRLGGLGEWGRFRNEAFPDVEVLAELADTAQIIYMDFMRVG